MKKTTAILAATLLSAALFSSGCGRKGPPVVPKPDSSVVVESWRVSGADVFSMAREMG
jgi:predicted small lipoprotein YifL